MEGDEKKAIGEKGSTNKRSSSMRAVFGHGDWVDAALMGLGLLGSIGDGSTLPVTLYILSSIMNHIGNTITTNDPHFLTDAINRVWISFIFVLSLHLNSFY